MNANANVLSVVVAGGFGITGTIVGVVMTTRLGRSAEQRRLAAEDDRRWLGDRRRVYSMFLTLAESMLRQIDEAAGFLSYDGVKDVPEEHESLRTERLTDYFARWDEELQPVLGDVQLLAGGDVADLASRVSGALMEITSVVEQRGPFIEFYPAWFRAQDLLGVARNAMRSELGLKDEITKVIPGQTGWPWLPDRPSEEDYIQGQTEIPGRPPLTDAEATRLDLDKN